MDPTISLSVPAELTNHKYVVEKKEGIHTAKTLQQTYPSSRWDMNHGSLYVRKSSMGCAKKASLTTEPWCSIPVLMLSALLTFPTVFLAPVTLQLQLFLLFFWVWFFCAVSYFTAYAVSGYRSKPLRVFLTSLVGLAFVLVLVFTGAYAAHQLDLVDKSRKNESNLPVIDSVIPIDRHNCPSHQTCSTRNLYTLNQQNLTVMFELPQFTPQCRKENMGRSERVVSRSTYRQHSLLPRRLAQLNNHTCCVMQQQDSLTLIHKSLVSTTIRLKECWKGFCDKFKYLRDCYEHLCLMENTFGVQIFVTDEFNTDLVEYMCNKREEGCYYTTCAHDYVRAVSGFREVSDYFNTSRWPILSNTVCSKIAETIRAVLPYSVCDMTTSMYKLFESELVTRSTPNCNLTAAVNMADFQCEPQLPIEEFSSRVVRGSPSQFYAPPTEGYQDEVEETLISMAIFRTPVISSEADFVTEQSFSDKQTTVYVATAPETSSTSTSTSVKMWRGDDYEGESMYDMYLTQPKIQKVHVNTVNTILTSPWSKLIPRVLKKWLASTVNPKVYTTRSIERKSFVVVDGKKIWITLDEAKKYSKMQPVYTPRSLDFPVRGQYYQELNGTDYWFSDMDSAKPNHTVHTTTGVKFCISSQKGIQCVKQYNGSYAWYLDDHYTTPLNDGCYHGHDFNIKLNKCVLAEYVAYDGKVALGNGVNVTNGFTHFQDRTTKFNVTCPFGTVISFVTGQCEPSPSLPIVRRESVDTPVTSSVVNGEPGFNIPQQHSQNQRTSRTGGVTTFPVSCNTARVVNGREVTSNVIWPIIYNEVEICTATAVGKSILLTAAHCFNMDMALYKVRINGSDYPITGIDLADFDPDTLENDVAMITVNHTFEYYDCYNTSRPKVGTKCLVAGYGVTEFGKQDMGVLRTTLEQTVVGCVQNAPTHFCMIGVNGSDSCQGDSGAGVYCKLDGLNYQLVGVVSFGEGCGQSESYNSLINTRFAEEIEATTFTYVNDYHDVEVLWYTILGPQCEIYNDMKEVTAFDRTYGTYFLGKRGFTPKIYWYNDTFGYADIIDVKDAGILAPYYCDGPFKHGTLSRDSRDPHPFAAQSVSTIYQMCTLAGYAMYSCAAYKCSHVAIGSSAQKQCLHTNPTPKSYTRGFHYDIGLSVWPLAVYELGVKEPVPAMDHQFGRLMVRCKFKTSVVGQVLVGSNSYKVVRNETYIGCENQMPDSGAVLGRKVITIRITDEINNDPTLRLYSRFGEPIVSHPMVTTAIDSAVLNDGKATIYTDDGVDHTKFRFVSSVFGLEPGWYWMDINGEKSTYFFLAFDVIMTLILIMMIRTMRNRKDAAARNVSSRVPAHQRAIVYNLAKNLDEMANGKQPVRRHLKVKDKNQLEQLKKEADNFIKQGDDDEEELPTHTLTVTEEPETVRLRNRLPGQLNYDSGHMHMKWQAVVLMLFVFVLRVYSDIPLTTYPRVSKVRTMLRTLEEAKKEPHWLSIWRSGKPYKLGSKTSNLNPMTVEDFRPTQNEPVVIQGTLVNGVCTIKNQKIFEQFTMVSGFVLKIVIQCDKMAVTKLVKMYGVVKDAEYTRIGINFEFSLDVKYNYEVDGYVERDVTDALYSHGLNITKTAYMERVDVGMEAYALVMPEANGGTVLDCYESKEENLDVLIAILDTATMEVEVTGVQYTMFDVYGDLTMSDHLICIVSNSFNFKVSDILIADDFRTTVPDFTSGMARAKRITEDGFEEVDIQKVQFVDCPRKIPMDCRSRRNLTACLANHHYYGPSDWLEENCEVSQPPIPSKLFASLYKDAKVRHMKYDPYAGTLSLEFVQRDTRAPLQIQGPIPRLFNIPESRISGSARLTGCKVTYVGSMCNVAFTNIDRDEYMVAVIKGDMITGAAYDVTVFHPKTGFHFWFTALGPDSAQFDITVNGQVLTLMYEYGPEDKPQLPANIDPTTRGVVVTPRFIPIGTWANSPMFFTLKFLFQAWAAVIVVTVFLYGINMKTKEELIQQLSKHLKTQ